MRSSKAKYPVLRPNILKYFDILVFITEIQLGGSVDNARVKQCSYLTLKIVEIFLGFHDFLTISYINLGGVSVNNMTLGPYETPTFSTLIM